MVDTVGLVIVKNASSLDQQTIKLLDVQKAKNIVL
jgi:hypothetical protein